MTTIEFFGPNRTRIGWPDIEWAVWVSGMDEIHEQPSAETALMYAADYNAGTAELHANDHTGLMPIVHAVVLRNGYAWSSEVEHRAGRDCGIQQCIHCGTDRNVTTAAAVTA